MDVHKATPSQARDALALMLSGVSSDPSSVEAMMQSWWKKLLFRHWVGPRMVQKQMDTFVVPDREDPSTLLGYFIVQYTGDVANTFDWGLVNAAGNQGTPPDSHSLSAFAALLGHALDWVQEHGQYPYFSLGLAASQSEYYAPVLKDEGMWLPDYQTVQMWADLPLPASPPLPEEIQMTLKLGMRYGEQASKMIPLDYARNRTAALAGEEPPGAPPDETLAEDIAAIAALHQASLRTAKIWQVERSGEPVGFVQQHTWQNELRMLLCLEPELWGTDTEHALIGHAAGAAGAGGQRLRLRTFSRKHLLTSRAMAEDMGLTWEEAPWQRWMVAL